MKTLVRKELDVNAPINIRRLSPMMKVYAGIITKWHTTKIYNTNLTKRLEAAHILQTQKDDRLKEVLLALFYRELTDNVTLGEKEKHCKKIVVAIQDNYQDSLTRILTHKDFLPYDIVRIRETSDIRLSFEKMPILLSVNKKVL